MTDPPIDLTQAREQDAPGTHDAKRQAPVHGHTGDLPSDKALSDRREEGDGMRKNGKGEGECPDGMGLRCPAESPLMCSAFF